MKELNYPKKAKFKEKRRILINAKTLNKRITQLGKKITEDYKGKELTIICVLKGAVYFFADLSRKIRLNANVEFIRASSYEGENSSGKVNFKFKLNEPVTGKNILIIEDIVDTGVTLKAILEYFKEQNPNTLKLCVLLDKPERRKVNDVKADYVGFAISNRFIVGYGLDFDEKYRNLHSIECIVRSEEECTQVDKEREEIEHQFVHFSC